MMIQESRTRFLLFDSACSACSELAREVERETDGLLVARSLREPQIQAWLNQARSGWRWEPMLLEVDGERPRAFTGLDMALRLVQVLGLRRAGRVARLVQRTPVPMAEMDSKRRQFLGYSGGLLLTMLGANLLAACGSTTSSAPSPTSATTAKVTGNFLAAASADSTSSTSHTWIALSTDGQQVTAYTCDGDDLHHITFAQWFFKGNVTNNTVDLTNADGAHLVATFTSRAATGTVTLPESKSFPFTANVIADPASKVGLYRSELTVGGVSYLAGWIIPTEQALNPLSTPTAFVGGLFAPAEDLLRSCCHECCMTGGIINEQTKQLLPAPRLTPQEISSGQVMVATLGTFALTHCRDGVCS